MAVRAERQGGHVPTMFLQPASRACQRPIDGQSYAVRDGLLYGKRQSGHPPTRNVRHPPDRPEPPRPVLKAVVEVDEERSAGLQLRNAVPHGSLSVGDVMENTQGE